MKNVTTNADRLNAIYDQYDADKLVFKKPQAPLDPAHELDVEFWRDARVVKKREASWHDAVTLVKRPRQTGLLGGWTKRSDGWVKQSRIRLGLMDPQPSPQSDPQPRPPANELLFSEHCARIGAKTARMTCVPSLSWSKGLISIQILECEKETSDKQDPWLLTHAEVYRLTGEPCNMAPGDTKTWAINGDDWTETFIDYSYTKEGGWVKNEKLVQKIADMELLIGEIRNIAVDIAKIATRLEILNA
jgi:hypothetical protein